MPSLKSNTKVIGITLGDPGGVGPEITAKALCHPSLKDLSFRIIGHSEFLQPFMRNSRKNYHIENTFQNFSGKLKTGKPTVLGAELSMIYLEKSIELLKSKEVNSLVTAPVCKEFINKKHPNFKGHTEFLADSFNINHDQIGMLFVTEQLKVIIATRHVAIKELISHVKPKTIRNTIMLTHQALKELFNIKNPSIAVCGLNPHAGEGGNIGKEELTIIKPVIAELRKKKLNINGPFAADTLFIPNHASKYDAIVSMYHDQGLTPIKSMYFHKLVNLTIGLPFIRTSPAHGTAFDIAGQNKADASSMIAAIHLAYKLSHD